MSMAQKNSEVASSSVASSSSIVVQVGQCGNQVAPQFFRLADNSSSPNGFVDHANFNRAVCIDTEDKVANIYTLNKGFKKCKYRDCNLVTGHFGRGSNWAMGYNLEERYGFRGEDTFMHSCLDRIRLEVEKCDCFMSTVMMHSLAGGTGSGVGSRVTQEVRDMFPNRYILSAVVAPLSVGENPMQGYNSLLCCNVLSQFTDQIILLQNDDFAYKFDKQPNPNNNTSSPKALRPTSGSASSRKAPVESLGFEHINQQFAFNLAGVLFPTNNVVTHNDSSTSKYQKVSVGMEVSELIRSVCPMPSLRFSRLDGVFKLEPVDNFDKLFSSLGVAYKSSLHFDDVTDKQRRPPRCISSVAVLRGCSKLFPKYDAVVNKLSFLKPVSWNPYPVDVWFGYNGILSKTSPSATICSNSSSVIDFLEMVWSVARLKFEQNAYLHWYERFECARSDFEDAFNNIASLINTYEDAVS